MTCLDKFNDVSTSNGWKDIVVFNVFSSWGWIIAFFENLQNRLENLRGIFKLIVYRFFSVFQFIPCLKLELLRD